ncbi:hypothetical protein BCR36DRAFT_408465 [Piromyces finnis]|uniref:F-box domain-containing protein n=1 Tax=Piromyces finnis TaxID=1754191 RepID=A0A1Y1VMG3_9FUNG|nr:hypothetical protein BCR36DRAFT_408465 [Piromyces finnis]|eukprot:ORX60104.1 hypothetical protein BCR36DRAFT_408465 [Piromyces finnis]
MIKNKKVYLQMSRTEDVQQKRNPLKITKFPLEIIYNILFNLDTKSLYNVLVTNKYLSKVAVACLWNDISLTNRSFLPFLLTFIEYYSLYYEFIFNNNNNSDYSHNTLFNLNLEKFYNDYIKYLNNKENKELNCLTKYYLRVEKPCIPYYPYLSYIKNVYIDNIDEKENGNELKENIELVQSLTALSTFLKYSNSQLNINPKLKTKSTFFEKVKSIVNSLPFTQYFNSNYSNNDLINIRLPIMNIQKLLVENVYVSNQNKVQFKDSLFKYSNNLKVIDLFYCEFPYPDLLYLPIHCPNITTLYLEHVNYDEYILLCYLFQFKNLRNFGFSLNKPLSPFALYSLKNNNTSCLSKLKSLRLNSSKDLLVYRYNNESYIEKRNDNSLNYDEIKNLSIDLDKFLNLIYNPGYSTWKYISKSCHNLTHLTLSFPIKHIILKMFFINNPYLEVVVIQDIKSKSRSNPTTKWDKMIQQKEEKCFECFPVLSHLKSLTLHSSYTYRLWFDIDKFNGWLKKLPELKELKLFIVEPISNYFYNIHNIFKDCYTIETLIISGPWFNEKCIKTLINNEKNNKFNHLKSLTISISDEVEPKEIKNLLCNTFIEKLELNIHSNFNIKELFNNNKNFNFSSISEKKTTYYLLNDEINIIKSIA